MEVILYGDETTFHFMSMLMRKAKIVTHLGWNNAKVTRDRRVTHAKATTIDYRRCQNQKNGMVL